jgi:peptide/nickel transport system ATP-binding protein/oligopeptide transport system ATP-binding protein
MNSTRDDKQPEPGTQTLLAVEDLRVYFRGEDKLSRAVDGIDLTVGHGEIVCLVGESGCGKTVSALSLLGLVDRPPAHIPTGSIMFKGRDLLDLDEAQFRSIRGNQIAMIFQEPMTSLNPVFTIGDQIAEAIATHQPAARQTAMQRAIQLLDDVEIASARERINDYPHQFSGGQRQRAMIAMALACGPELLIADEPTTALDVTVQAQILQLFRKLQTQRDMALLMITHNLGVVAEIAERVYVMYAGTIVEAAGVGQIFKNPLHPYTMGLLAAIPGRTTKGRPLYSIPGSVPDPAYKPQGCPFHPRCPYAEQACRTQFPEMNDFGRNHHARCPVVFRLAQDGKLTGANKRIHSTHDKKGGPGR